ncbi:MAG: transglutaminase family protein, partial [Planctomycetes bacterium]|nr:transglutaminase family protein [Planctomycetota bacterium]
AGLAAAQSTVPAHTAPKNPKPTPATPAPTPSTTPITPTPVNPAPAAPASPTNPTTPSPAPVTQPPTQSPTQSPTQAPRNTQPGTNRNAPGYQPNTPSTNTGGQTGTTANQRQTTPASGPTVMPGTNMPAADFEWPKVSEGPYVQKTMPHDWLLQVIVDLASNGNVNQSLWMSSSTPFVFDSMTLVFPVVPATGLSDVNTGGVQSWLRFEGHEMMSGPFAKEWTREKPAPVLLQRMASGQLYPAGVMLGKWYWENPNSQTRTIQLMMQVPITSYRTILDDAAANKVPWPKGSWPEVAAACFQPQMFIDCGIDPVTFEMKMYNMKPIQDAVRDWTKGNPKELTPHKLAKFLTHKVVHGMIPGKPDIWWGGQQQAILGLDLLGAPLAMETRQIGLKDMGTVLVAVMREAGLPARMVFGYQAVEVVQDGNKAVTFSNNDRFRAWVEYCLYDEEKKTINWVPIDYQQFRFTSNAMPSLDQAWTFIGTLPYGQTMVPVALQAFPPTTVMGYGYPALWGWVLQPGVPVNLGQWVTVSTSRAGVGPKNPRNNQGESQNPPNQVR